MPVDSPRQGEHGLLDAEVLHQPHDAGLAGELLYLRSSRAQRTVLGGSGVCVPVRVPRRAGFALISRDLARIVRPARE